MSKVILPKDPLDLIRNCPRDVLLKELDRASSEDSLSFFIKKAWPNIDPSDYVHGWHIDAVAEHLEACLRGQIRHLIINQPPRTMKSISSAVALCPWAWAQRKKGPLLGPQVRFMYASYAHHLSLRDSVKSRRLIESPWYQSNWGNRYRLTSDQNTKVKFDNDKGGYRLSTSVGGALTGEGADVIVIDDALNAAEAVSEAIIESTTAWWDESMSTRLNDPKTGVYIIVMQRLAEGDLTGHVLDRNDPNWTHLCLPMRLDSSRKCYTSLGNKTWEDPRTEDRELLWPERYGEKEVRGLELALGPYAAAAQLEQMPTPRGGGIFKRDWWQIWPPPGYDDTAKLQFPMMDYICVSVDTAFTEKQENDYSACVMLGVWKDKGGIPRIMLMKAWQERLEFHALVEKIIETCRNKTGSPADALLIEAKANGISVAQEIQRLCSDEEFAVHKINPGAQDKVARAYAVQHLFSAGVIYAPDRKYADMVIGAMEIFPKGKNDDLCDAMIMGVNFLRRIGLAVLADEGRAAITAEMMYRPQQESIAENYGV